MEKIDLLSEFSSGPRLEMLKILENSDLKPSQIAKKMGMSIQALTRHIDRLTESKLAEKTPKGEYRLTPLAKASLSQLPFFAFLDKHHEYFSTHDFSGIPDNFISRIGELENCELERNLMKSMQQGRDYCINAKKFLNGVMCMIPLEFFDVILENLKQGCKVKLLFGKNSVVPKGFSKHPSRIEYLKYKKSGQVEEKIIENVPIIVSTTENESQMIFANKDLGFPDTKGVFFSKDPKFSKWCQDLIDYYWSLPEVINFVLKEQ
jgi:predicted transcriptional regulator